jgi:hypothetical protein
MSSPLDEKEGKLLDIHPFDISRWALLRRTCALYGPRRSGADVFMRLNGQKMLLGTSPIVGTPFHDLSDGKEEKEEKEELPPLEDSDLPALVDIVPSDTTGPRHGEEKTAPVLAAHMLDAWHRSGASALSDPSRLPTGNRAPVADQPNQIGDSQPEMKQPASLPYEEMLFPIANIPHTRYWGATAAPIKIANTPASGQSEAAAET